MRLLLDTHVFLWLVQEHPVPPAVLAKLEDRDNDVFLSLVTPWEMQIKVGTGQLALAQTIRATVETALARDAVRLLPITLAHIDALAHLPGHHRDPFDRLLVAQALHETLTLVAADAGISLYDVPVLWA